MVGYVKLKKLGCELSYKLEMLFKHQLHIIRQGQPEEIH